MKILRLIFPVFILLACIKPACAESVWGIFPGMDGPAAVKMLGNPTKTADKKDFLSYFYIDQFGYGSRFIIDIDKSNNAVDMVMVYKTDPSVRTEQGVFCGNSPRKIKDIYGKPKDDAKGILGGEEVFYYIYEIRTFIATQKLYFVFSRADRSLEMMVLSRKPLLIEKFL
ncbi:MAG: hypothetical protein M1536_05235 [Firmicutes bacterium]|nr:hypothetical protein [Bacillota bacterium]